MGSRPVWGDSCQDKAAVRHRSKSKESYAFAGLWEKWKDRKAGTEPLTFTVITTDPNEVVQPMHDRMPVIIPERELQKLEGFEV